MSERTTLAALAAGLDAQRFVGRIAELQTVSAALEHRSPHRVVHVCGPGGIGKSGLLRAVARLSVQHSRSVHVLDGRHDLDDLCSITAAIDPAFDEVAPVIIIDEFSALHALQHRVRRMIIDGLPADGLVARQPSTTGTRVVPGRPRSRQHDNHAAAVVAERGK